MSFEKIIKFTLSWEGGSKVTHDPNDPGGTTKYGISQKSFPDLDIENLTLEDAMAIYKKEYWDPIAKGVDDNVDMAAFDSAVNCGVGTVHIWLNNPAIKTYRDVIQARKTRYYNLVSRNAHLNRYLNGWLNRCKALLNFILQG